MKGIFNIISSLDSLRALFIIAKCDCFLLIDYLNMFCTLHSRSGKIRGLRLNMRVQVKCEGSGKIRGLRYSKRAQVK